MQNYIIYEEDIEDGYVKCFITNNLHTDLIERYEIKFNLRLGKIGALSNSMVINNIETNIENDFNVTIFEMDDSKKQQKKIGSFHGASGYLEEEIEDFIRYIYETHNKPLLESTIKKFNNYSNIKESKSTKIKEYKFNDYLIRCGKSAENNDMLTFNLTKETDIFLHVKGFPGSHVIISSKSDEVTPSDVIKYAAQIAADNSKAPNNSNATVVAAKKKFVTKSPGMAPGKVAVDYRNSEEITVFKK